MSEFSDWVSVTEAADILGVAPQTIRNAVLAQLPVGTERRWLGNRWMLRREALDHVTIRPASRPRVVTGLL